MNQRKPARAIARQKRSVPYKEMPNGMRFRTLDSDHQFVKLCDAQALDDTTGKDAIFAMNDICVPIRAQIGYYPLFNA